jgi:hypothetical protein
LHGAGTLSSTDVRPLRALLCVIVKRVDAQTRAKTFINSFPRTAE